MRYIKRLACVETFVLTFPRRITNLLQQPKDCFQTRYTFRALGARACNSLRARAKNCAFPVRKGCQRIERERWRKRESRAYAQQQWIHACLCHTYKYLRPVVKRVFTRHLTMRDSGKRRVARWSTQDGNNSTLRYECDETFSDECEFAARAEGE